MHWIQARKMLALTNFIMWKMAIFSDVLLNFYTVKQLNDLFWDCFTRFWGNSVNVVLSIVQLRAIYPCKSPIGLDDLQG